MKSYQKAKTKYQRYLIEKCNQSKEDVLNSNISINELKNLSKIFKMISKEKA